MLTNTSESIVISNFGWVDRGGLWTYRVSEQQERHVTFGEAHHLTLYAGTDDHFSVVHHNDGTRVEISVHRFDDVSMALGRAVVEAEGSSVSGSASAWAHVPTNYAAYYKGPETADFVLIRVDPVNQRVSLQQFNWYTDKDYDKGFQGVVGVTEIPGDSRLLISVQRDSRLVLYDPIAQRKRRLIELAGRGSVRALFFTSRTKTLWAQDHDTIVKLDPRHFRILSSHRIGATDGPSFGQLVGSFWLNRDETMCVVPRPHAGDVVALDPIDLKIQSRCTTGHQPLAAVALATGSVIARDWQTGSLLRGQL
jgi:hypothetical protein